MFAPKNQPPEFRNLPDRCLRRDAKSTGTIGTCTMVPHRQTSLLCRNLPGSPFSFSRGRNVVFRNSPGLASAGICRIAHSNSRSQPPRLQAFSPAPNWPASLHSCRILPEPPISYQLVPFSRLSVQFPLPAFRFTNKQAFMPFLAVRILDFSVAIALDDADAGDG